jgi:hypothetical protein
MYLKHTSTLKKRFHCYFCLKDSVNFRKILNRNYPRIDNALKKIEESSSTSSTNIENYNNNSSFDYNEDDGADEDNDDDDQNTFLQEDRLGKLETQIKKLVSMKHLLQDQIKNGKYLKTE